MAVSKTFSAATRTDQIGKVFKVLAAGVRECLICEQVFTRQDSARHANVVCWPEKRP